METSRSMKRRGGRGGSVETTPKEREKGERERGE